jgi:hypothetical protein
LLFSKRVCDLKIDLFGFVNDVVLLFVDELESEGAGNGGGKGEGRDESARKSFCGIEYCGGAKLPDANAANRKFPAEKKGEKVEAVYAEQSDGLWNYYRRYFSPQRFAHESRKFVHRQVGLVDVVVNFAGGVFAKSIICFSGFPLFVGLQYRRRKD